MSIHILQQRGLAYTRLGVIYSLGTISEFFWNGCHSNNEKECLLVLRFSGGADTTAQHSKPHVFCLINDMRLGMLLPGVVRGWQVVHPCPPPSPPLSVTTKVKFDLYLIILLGLPTVAKAEKSDPLNTPASAWNRYTGLTNQPIKANTVDISSYTCPNSLHGFLVWQHTTKYIKYF